MIKCCQILTFITKKQANIVIQIVENLHLHIHSPVVSMANHAKQYNKVSKLKPEYFPFF